MSWRTVCFSAQNHWRCTNTVWSITLLMWEWGIDKGWKVEIIVSIGIFTQDSLVRMECVSQQTEDI